jgi:putative ABC transport system permease protein
MAEFTSDFARFRYDLRSALSLAWDSILAHKLRSFLTLLGVMIGVASVILVGAAIDGLGTFAKTSTEKAFGSETYIVAQIASVGGMTPKERVEHLKHNRQIRLVDERYLQANVGETTLFSPYRNTTVDTTRNNLRSEDTTVLGSAATLVDIRDLVIVDGRFFSPTEEQNAAFVAVIGQDLKNNLFPGIASPLGKTFKIQDLDFTVLGVQEKLGSSGPNGSQDNSAYIPITTFSRLFGPGQSMIVFGRAKPGTGVTLQQSLDATRVALRTHFHQRPNETDRFDFLTPDAIRGFIDNILSLVAAVVVPVTFISLVVGGIVIMNIMLVSVTERTREIGIRKSLGARRQDIMMQILIEAIVMAGAGGAIGVTVGGIVTAILSSVLGVSLKITPFYIILSVFVSAAVGIISGWYPASKASKLDPIVALRAD